MRVAAAVALPLAYLSACTLLNSESGLAGPPLANDGGSFDAAAAAAVDGRASEGAVGSGDAAQGQISDGSGGTGVSKDSASPPPAATQDASSAPDAGPVAIYDQLLSPLGLAVHAGTLCWCAGDTLRMVQCAPSGGAGADASGPTTVATQSNDVLVSDAFDVALDDTYVYWSNGPNNQVVRQARSGGASAAYFTGDQRLSYIVLDGANVWASDYVAGGTNGNIVVGPSGTSSQLIFPSETLAAGVAVYSGSVYWGRGTPAEISFALEAGNTTIARLPTAGPVTGLAIDASGTTYFLSGNTQVYRLAQGASTPVMLYDAGTSFGDSDLALDDGAVYWSEHDRGRIMKLAR